MSIITAENCEGFGDGLHLQLASLLALLPLLVSHLTLLLQHHQELLISGQRGLGVLQIGRSLGILLVSRRQLIGLGIYLRLACGDLLLLGGLEISIRLLVLGLFLL